MGAHTLTQEQLPTHDHGIPGNWENAQGHGEEQPPVVAYDMNENSITSSAGESQTHTHSLAVSTNNANLLPSFYALSFIMRCE